MAENVTAAAGARRRKREDHDQPRPRRPRPHRPAGAGGLLLQPHRLHPLGDPRPARHARRRARAVDPAAHARARPARLHRGGPRGGATGGRDAARPRGRARPHRGGRDPGARPRDDRLASPSSARCRPAPRSSAPSPTASASDPQKERHHEHRFRPGHVPGHGLACARRTSRRRRRSSRRPSPGGMPAGAAGPAAAPRRFRIRADVEDAEPADAAAAAAGGGRRPLRDVVRPAPLGTPGARTASSAICPASGAPPAPPLPEGASFAWRSHADGGGRAALPALRPVLRDGRAAGPRRHAARLQAGPRTTSPPAPG